MALELRKLSYPLGAEVCDIDLAKPILGTPSGYVVEAA
jgi:hypothetical protein